MIPQVLQVNFEGVRTQVTVGHLFTLLEFQVLFSSLHKERLTLEGQVIFFADLEKFLALFLLPCSSFSTGSQIGGIDSGFMLWDS